MSDPKPPSAASAQPSGPPSALPPEAGTGAKSRIAAVIDIGATSIRMVIAEIDPAGHVRRLESLRKGVPLGKNTFSRGAIDQDTIRDCVEILKGFEKVMAEYGINDPSQVHAVATSSVREAQNGDNFRDRVAIATGINIKVIDEPEESRLTFMAAQEVLEARPGLGASELLFVDVGGGSTELLLLRKGEVAFSNSYPLGTLRTREALETYKAPPERIRRLLTQHLTHAVDTMRRDMPEAPSPVLVAMSGDARFAASQVFPGWNEADLAETDLKTLSAFADKVIGQPAERLVAKYQMSYEEAETLGPGLLAYLILARSLKSDRIVIPKTSFRDGLLRDLAFGRPWTDAFAGEVVRSALALGRKYDVDEGHARHVADLSVRLFAVLQKGYRLSPRHGLVLRVAGLLHEVGGFINNRSHHKHSMYIILNSDVFGLSRDDLTLVALISRYHRRALPSLNHPEYAALVPEQRITVSKLAAILRVADALDRGHIQQVREPAVTLSKDELVITAENVEDLTLERMALKDKGRLMEDVYGLRVVLQEGRPARGEEAHGA
jgi:exopolyphosphatase/guanosine-5'-triphosphate,3'-diphosphate pyrophosphatase